MDYPDAEMDMFISAVALNCKGLSPCCLPYIERHFRNGEKTDSIDKDGILHTNFFYITVHYNRFW